ncbi:hypothetical protein [Rhodococcus sp. AW25M09]|uniref:hypothetical protein n=1 Tax=Rhodococcus sp. AW25M09 TaxID=1268303 RepID=UPI0018DEE0E7|nr:hypothetical protein [Rhodococcus sp. AW25M09]
MSKPFRTVSGRTREMGHTEIADAAFDYVDGKDDVTPWSGVARYAGLSTQGNLYSLMTRSARPSVNRDLVGRTALRVEPTW